jgi:signal transduction histidine kinase
VPEDALANLPAFAWTLDRAGNLTSQAGRKELRASLGPWAADAHRHALGGETSSRRVEWRGGTLEIRIEPRLVDGRIEGSAGVAVEVCPLPGAEDVEALARVAAGVAHDFNNLLVVIGGHASLLAREVESGSGEQLRVEEILRAVRRGAKLTERLQAFVSST